MDVSYFTDISLKSLHQSIKDCLDKDDALKRESKDFIYGVREYADWKVWCLVIEDEMKKRSMDFQAIAI